MSSIATYFEIIQDQHGPRSIHIVRYRRCVNATIIVRMVTVGMTVGLAFVGYMATYLNGLRLGQRQARLVRINQQLSEFYGPLLALMEANQRTFDAFHADFALADGRCPICDVPAPSEQDLAEWRFWAKTCSFRTSGRCVMS